MSRTVAIIQARLGSARLPGKVLYELAGRPMIGLMVERVRRAQVLDEVVLAIADGPANDALARVAEELGIPVHRGPEQDVLARYAGAARVADADVIIRLTGDCPLADPDVITAVTEQRGSGGLDYCTNVYPPSWPDGLDVSAFTRKTLEWADREAKLPSEREHVVPWMWAQSSLEGGTVLSAANVPCPQDMSAHRWTVDSAGDYAMMRALAGHLGSQGLVQAGWREIAATLDAHPELSALNADEIRDEGLAESRKHDVMPEPSDG